MRRAKHFRAETPSWILCFLLISLIIVLWIVFVGGTSRDEMIVGSAVLLLSCAFLYLVWRKENLRLDFTLYDITQGWRIPWSICTGTYEVIAIFVKDLFRVKRAGSFYRVIGFKTSDSDPRLIARRVLATFYTTMSPDVIAIGVDDRQNRALFHQFERSNLPKITRTLGAESEGRRL